MCGGETWNAPRYGMNFSDTAGRMASYMREVGLPQVSSQANYAIEFGLANMNVRPYGTTSSITNREYNLNKQKENLKEYSEINSNPNQQIYSLNEFGNSSSRREIFGRLTSNARELMSVVDKEIERLTLEEEVLI